MRTPALRHPGRPLVPTATGLAAAALAVLLSALLAVPVLAGLATPARAHDVLVGSDPADGATLDVPPGHVVLTFSADQMALGNALAVTDPAGTDHVVGAAVVEGRELRQELDGAGPAGEWTVQWRSVASDGHPVSGTLTFTVSTAAEGGAEAQETSDEVGEDTASAGASEATEPAGPTGSGGTTEPVEVTGRAVATTDGDTDPSPADGADDTPRPWLVVGLVLGALALAATAWAMVRRLGPRDDEGTPERRP